MTDLTRRDFLKVLGLGTVGTAGALALAGCRTGGDTKPAETAPASEKPAASGSGGGSTGTGITDIGTSAATTELDLTTTGESKGNVTKGPDAAQRTLIAEAAKTFETLDPFFITGQNLQRICRMCIDTLWDIKWGTSEEIGIGAKSWTFEEDDKVVNFEIYDNIYDYEGNHITMDDVQFYYDYFTGTANKKINTVVAMETTGTYTGKITLKNKHYPGSLPAIYLLSRAAYEASEDGFRTNIIGSGLYKPVAFISGSGATFEQTYTYWGDQEAIAEKLPQHTANFDFVRMDVITEESQIATALRTNVIQVYDIQVSTAEDFLADPGDVAVHKFPALYPSYLEFNMYPGSPFADNPALRQAIAYGINWEDVAYAATMGYGTSTGVIGYNGLAGYNTDWETDGSAYRYDQELAKQKLEEAGYKPGELTLKFTYNRTPNDFAVMQQNLADIGINLEMDLRDEVSYMASRGAANLLDWDILAFDTAGNGFLTNIFYTMCDNTSYAWGQMNGANDQEMFDLAVAARYGTQEDVDKCYHALMERFWFIPRFNDQSFIAGYNKVEQIVVNNSQQLMAQACLAADDYDVYY